MKKTLKEHRQSQQLSQQELADLAHVSVRSIQRIEKDHYASAYVIRSLCEALKISVNDLEISESKLANIESQSDIVDDNNSIINSNIPPEGALKIINFSALMVLIVPFSNLLLPAILYWIFPLSDPAKRQAKHILSFQLFWILVTLFAVILTWIMTSLLGIFEVARYPLFVWIYVGLVMVNASIIMQTAAQINARKPILTFVPEVI